MTPNELREKAEKLLLADDRERIPSTREIYWCADSLQKDETIAKTSRELEVLKAELRELYRTRPQKNELIEKANYAIHENCQLRLEIIKKDETIADLTARLQGTKKRISYLEERYLPCPDCRDKVESGKCLHCENQRLRRENEELKSKLEESETWSTPQMRLLQVKMIEDYKSVCEQLSERVREIAELKTANL